MLNDEICKLRDKLNNSIIQGKDYSIVYKISIELDELIAKYYKQEIRVDQIKKTIDSKKKLVTNHIDTA